MKTGCYQKIGNTAICVILLFTFSTFTKVRAQSLWVSGSTNPTAVNGLYIKQSGTQFGYSYWKHETQDYYIYNDDYYGSRYWNIDNDFDDETVNFYSQESSDPVPTGLIWNAYTGSSGTVNVVEYSAEPEIEIRGNSTVIADGDDTPVFADHTHFGTQNVSSGSMIRTYTIYNLGAGTLNLTDASPYVAISGTHSADFTVSSAPSASIAASGNTTFQITFDPTGSGDRTATISLANDDADENPYTFAVKGRGATSSDLLVASITNPAAANGTYINQGLLYNFEYWKHESENYYLFNDDYSGTRYWNLDVDTDDSDDDYLFYYVSEAGTPVGLTGWSKNSTGGITGDPFITQGELAPEIVVLGNDNEITDDDTSPSFTDHTDFGTLNVSSGTRSRTFDIENNGTASLNLTESSPYVIISGAASSDFSVSAVPSSSIAAGNSTTFEITFNPSAAGTRSASLSFDNDDSDEDPFNFNIQGRGIIPQDLAVSGITTPAAANGNYIHQGILYEFQYWKHETQNYYIYNDDFSGTRY